tara:strand:+ start:213 stop:383 length:171 start_codon:yes stop_codon:yes gene_type:complete
MDNTEIDRRLLDIEERIDNLESMITSYGELLQQFVEHVGEIREAVMKQNLSRRTFF